MGRSYPDAIRRNAEEGLEILEVLKNRPFRNTRPLGDRLGGWAQIAFLNQHEQRVGHGSAGTKRPGGSAVAGCFTYFTGKQSLATTDDVGGFCLHFF